MERIGAEVERELARSGSRDALALAAVTAAWPEVVGETVARHAWPLRLGRSGTLHVATSSATWAFELDRLSPEVLESLAARLGSDSPHALRFAVGPVPEPGPPPAAGTSPASSDAGEPTPDEVAEASALAAAIEDSELRELVARAARASLVRARSGRRF
jgi:hypothetical protein